MSKPKIDFLAILQALIRRHVDFIVVGGVAAVLHGAPMTTFDLVLVHSRDADNLDRLLIALVALDARYRTPREQSLRPDRSHLSSPGHQLLMTKFGPLDLLGAIGSGHSYGDLLPHTVEVEISNGVKIRALDLPMLIRTKEEAGSEKDRAALIILRRTLEEKAKAGE